MILELELAALCVLAALPALKQIRASKKAPTAAAPLAIRPDGWEDHAIGPIAPAPRAHDTQTHEILKRAIDGWLHVGFRHTHHPDIREALVTPGLAVRHADGSIHEGNQ